MTPDTTDSPQIAGWSRCATTRSVKAHLLRAFAKLGVDDRTHAVTVAMQGGFLDA